MKKRSTFFLCLLSLILISSVSRTYAVGDVYYVAPSGSDLHGNGDLQNPWATISYAINQVSDGSTILVQPGMYVGKVQLKGQFDLGVTVRSAVPYQAKLRNSGSQVVTCFYGQGITLEGFDIAHSMDNTAALVIQVQDLLGVPGLGDGTDPVVSRITLRNNIIHDSTNNDLLKINNGARDIVVEGNMFFNQQGSDEHIDINSVANVVVHNNIFFNYFEENSDTSSFIVIKDSNGNTDGQIGSEAITLHKNVFLNWQGSSGNNFILLGEDGNPYYEAKNVLVENNLMIGNSGNIMRSPFGVKGGRDIVFRHNTIVGDLPSHTFAMRLNQEGQNPINENISFFNNVWSDPTGTMGSEANLTADFAEVPVLQNGEIILDNNLYWNNGQSIPSDASQKAHFSDDANRSLLNPRFGEQSGIIVPYWNGRTFADSSTTIRQAFERLVNCYGQPANGSPIKDSANSTESPSFDILGNSRDHHPDLGAFEMVDTDELFLPLILAIEF